MSKITEAFVLKIVWSFARAFLAVFLAGATGLLTLPNFTAVKAALIALVIASLVAGIRALQAALLDPSPTVPTDNVS